MPILSESPHRFTEAVSSVSPTVAAVFERIMQQIQTGVLTPGSLLRDAEIAADFGVSRTPVREAISLLRDVGVLEVSANRYTRVVATSPERTRQLSNVWFPLHQMVVRELVADAPLDRRTLASLEDFQEQTVEAVAAHDPAQFSTATARFYDVLLGRVDNPGLRRATSSVVHAFRLGIASLGVPFDTEAAARSQRLLIDALRDGDAATAEASLSTLESIVIPVD